MSFPSSAPPWTVAGSIVRILVKDFMQYSEVEFRPGANLNVIIGPNGSGKSSLVNAICLGLAGKTSVLGRASNLAEFIRTGQNEATTEIELFHPKGNRVVRRSWSRGAKPGSVVSKWWLDGKQAKEKEVVALTQSLQIQVDNLCQFLPQDKVQDFSKMNSKALLNSTVDAVGETELKEKHERLIKMNTNLGERAARHEMKKATLADNKKKCSRLEDEVKVFKEKEHIEAKISLAEKKAAWDRLDENRIIAIGHKHALIATETDLKGEEDKLVPLKEKCDNLIVTKRHSDDKQKTLLTMQKESVSKAKKQMEQLEKIEEEVTGLEDALTGVDERVVERKRNIEKMQAEVGRLEAEVAQASLDSGVLAKIAGLNKQMQQTNNRVAEAKQTVESLNYGHKADLTGMKKVQGILDQMQNVDTQKLESLRRLQPSSSVPAGGTDVHKALQWLRQNKDQFKHPIYEPMLLSMDIKNKEDAVYFENVIGMRDLIAFSAEDKDDMNRFINICKDDLGLSVNVVHADPNRRPEDFATRDTAPLRATQFKGFLKDMFTAPAPVVAYLCLTYRLHEVPAFGARAETQIEQLTSAFRLFFVEKERYSVRTSAYSGEKSTTTNFIHSKNLFGASADQSRIDELSRQLDHYQSSAAKKLDELKQRNADLKAVERELEEERNALKEQNARKDYMNQRKNQLRLKESQLKQFLSSEPDSERERARIVQEKARKADAVIAAVLKLQEAIFACNAAHVKIRLEKLSCEVSADDVAATEETLREAEEATSGLRRRRDEAKEVYDRGMEDLAARLREAKAATGTNTKARDKPAQEYVDQWREHNMIWPDGKPNSARCAELLQELRDEVEQFEDVDPRVVNEYRLLKESIEALELELSTWDASVADQRAKMESVRIAWRRGLDALVGRVNARFAAFFATMGFAGEVKLHEGNATDDFANYGIDILVKYRASVALQKLTASHQSGGERSVATALYMLSLQELTQVPFRCVDEINQGMDAKNERRVFDLIVQTSCFDNSAQYFLLTPKLLPNLKYERRMTMLVVNNGPAMCHHSAWNMDKFRAAAARRVGRDQNATMGVE